MIASLISRGPAIRQLETWNEGHVVLPGDPVETLDVSPVVAEAWLGQPGVLGAVESETLGVICVKHQVVLLEVPHLPDDVGHGGCACGPEYLHEALIRLQPA